MNRETAYRIGVAFGLGLASFRRKLANDAEEWTTVHPNGKENKGQPVLIDGETNRILGGMGGKHTGKTIAEVKKETQERREQKSSSAATSAKTGVAVPPAASAPKTEPPFQRVESEISRDCDSKGIAYNEVAKHEQPLPEEEIISRVSGVDKTSGSCNSLALAYVGQRLGLDVEDLRGGESQKYFKSDKNIAGVFHSMDVWEIYPKGKTADKEIDEARRYLKSIEEGKQYFFSAGEHSAIVRRREGELQFLELQPSWAFGKGWQNFGKSPQAINAILKRRFWVNERSRYHFGRNDPKLYGIDSVKITDEGRTILGYINTRGKDQKNGK